MGYQKNWEEEPTEDCDNVFLPDLRIQVLFNWYEKKIPDKKLMVLDK